MKTRYRTGTGPFMDIGLLRKGDPPAHKYRHDLESFAYVYAYTVAEYNPEEKTFGFIAQWQHSSLVAIGDSKRSFLMSREEGAAVFSKAHPAFQPLLERDAFLIRLLTLFASLERLRDKINVVTWSYLRTTLDAGTARWRRSRGKGIRWSRTVRLWRSLANRRMCSVATCSSQFRRVLVCTLCYLYRNFQRKRRCMLDHGHMTVPSILYFVDSTLDLYLWSRTLKG